MIGKTLRHRYEIESLLGEGSTAAVYLARDHRLNRVVALKILLPHVNESARKRFFQEAQSVAQLNHPGIMALYDMDEEDGKAFLVVEYVAGRLLSETIPASVAQVVALGRQIAEALNYAHERKIIHRDIKPANIMVTPDGQTKIMDLGLALPREAKRVTAAGMIIGTPAYLSPEQAQGMTLDHRTDIYSLGVVLYEMVTGMLPFASDDIPALLLQHVRQPAPPPSIHVPSLPLALENVILKALEKNPSRRFQSGDALARSLDAALLVDPLATAGALDATRPASSVHVDNLPVRVYVADDHTVLRRSLVSFIGQHDAYLIVGEAGDGETAQREVLELRPNVLLLDLNMPVKGGLDVLPIIRAKAPDVRVLILTGRDEEWYIMRALRAGAHGYLLKSSSEDELIDAIEKVSGGQLVLGRGVAEKVVTGMLRASDDHLKLNEIERQIMLLVAGGLDNEAIAGRLDMPLSDLIEALASAMDKMAAKDRHAAALQAVRRGEILLEELQDV
ncbi:MAG: protein kinase [Chloroflexota bacterium]|nr:protein kinase [Chloroflexota bacterium]